MISFLKSKAFVYVCFALAIIALGAGYLGFIPQDISYGIAGILGFGGFDALRSFINSQSKWNKSRISAWAGILISLLQLIGIITPEIQAQITAFIASILGIGYQQALSKQNN